MSLPAGYFPMETAPKDTPILGWCRDQCGHPGCGYCTGNGTSLCLYHGHVEGLSHVEDGPHVLVWGGAWDDSTHEYSGGWMPDWWFRSDSEFEVAANPVAWAPIPKFESPQPLADCTAQTRTLPISAG